MNIFQWIACGTLSAAIVRNFLPIRRPFSWKFRFIRSMVWFAAIVAVVNPTQVTRLANLLGIGRGADIILYGLTLAFLAVSFFFYAQQIRLRRELSKLAGHLALTNASRGGMESNGGLS
jgi:hypothetical protein